jgi:hypothetical protein
MYDRRYETHERLGGGVGGSVGALHPGGRGELWLCHYPVLHRLEEQGFITSHWQESEAGRKRKYYALKLAGRKALREQKEQWQLVHATLGKLWGVQHVRTGTVS